jgi:hypothetical protein
MNKQEIYNEHYQNLLESDSVRAGMFDKFEYESMTDYLHARATYLTEQTVLNGVDDE